jgi:hypothetical protein
LIRIGKFLVRGATVSGGMAGCMIIEFSSLQHDKKDLYKL